MAEGCTCRSNPPPCEGTSTTLWCGCVFNGQTLYPSCNGAGTFIGVVFGSMGTPSGDCGSYDHGDCSAPPAVVAAAIEERCIGQPECEVPATVADLADGVDPCFGVQKFTAVILECSAEIPTDFERFRREWGLLSLLVVMFAGFVIYVVGGAMLYPRGETQAVAMFGNLGVHPHAHNWLALLHFVQDGFTYVFGGSSLPAPDETRDDARKKERRKKKNRSGEKSGGQKKKKRKNKKGSRTEPLLQESREESGGVHSSQQKIKVQVTI